MHLNALLPFFGDRNTMSVVVYLEKVDDSYCCFVSAEINVLAWKQTPQVASLKQHGLDLCYLKARRSILDSSASNLAFSN